MSALLDSKSELWPPLSLLPWPTIWESNIFHLVYFTYRQSFQLLSWVEVVSKAQRSCRDRAPLLHSHQHLKCLNGKASIAERPRLAPTSLLSAFRALSAFYTSWVGPPRWIYKWFRSKVIALSFWFSAGCCHGWIQRDPPISPVPRRVAAMERSKVIYPIQVCWRELGPHQEGLLWPSHEVHWIPCWLGSYFSSSSLMTFIPPSDTSCCSFTCCLAGPHYILEKNYWMEAEWTLRLLRRYVSHVSPSPGLVKLLALSN